MTARLRLRHLLALLVVITVQVMAVNPSPARAAEPSGSAQPPPNSLRVINYNTMLLSGWMTLDNSQFANRARVRAMLDSGIFDGQDVMVLQELFNVDSSKQLLNGLYDQGYRYQTRVVGASHWDGTHAREWDAEHLGGGGLENGGVAVVSRHPIETAEQQVFVTGCGADKHAQKGFAYARINKDGHVFHVAGTHPQSTDGGCGARRDAAAVRAGQFEEIDRFLTGKEGGDEIGAGEPVLLVGDMNVDRYTPEYQDMLARLHARDGSTTGERYSFDPQANELAAVRYPDDGPEDLDFVLQREGHAPLQDWAGEVVRPRATAPIEVEGRTGPGGIFIKDQVRDLSDHYAIVASGRLPERSADTWQLRVDRVRMVAGDEQDGTGDDLYGDVTVNGRYLWSVARSASLDDRKFPYDLPGISPECVSGAEGSFTIRVHVVDNDTVGDDELVDGSLTWRAADDAPGTHTVTMSGPYGAAELTYTVDRA
ncbi:sphingomyelin phosphodiesterase [Streptomyces sp. NBC_00347]|uniref:sphingomyelin phosphodiesterase n=1 Tax=Streptomyces sp. NBC_00347 TaxID=2975721 RepID=UPI0022522B36|nr:sphingomyelin phosphodiesterase [Streptomyces sp. NBC_00347]MCX5126991.1 sphingomyelin phosphodiesterase [Streptomyces sp. NBC_00347]